MTQEMNLGDVSQNINSTPSVESSSQHEPSPQAPVEKMVPQSKVDEIAKTIKYQERMARDEAVERARRETEARYTQSQNIAPSMAANDDISKLVQNEVQKSIGALTQQAQQQALQKQANDIVNNFSTKMNAGKGKYDDFDEVVNSVDYQHMGNFVGLATAQVDNLADVVYDLAKNRPLQLVQLEQLAATQPNLARRQLQELSESIKLNDKAKKVERPSEPLRQITQSNVGIDDGSDESVAYFRKSQPWKK